MLDERGPQNVQRFLKPLGIEIQELTADTSTAITAAAALETSVGSIAKSLLFHTAGDPVLVIASGDTRVSTDRLGEHLGASDVRLAKPREVVEATGFKVGGVPPVAHATRIRVLMDRALLQYAVVYAAAGSPLAIFPIEPHQLQTIAEAELVDVAESQ